MTPVSEADAAKVDRWLLWPTVTSVTTFTVLALVGGIPGPLTVLLTFATVITLIAIAIALLAAAVVFAFRKRFRMAASFLFSAVVPALLRLPLNWIANCIHLVLTVWFGAGYLGPAVKPDNRGFIAYDWSVGLAGGAAIFLIHDPSGKVAFQPDKHTAELSAQSLGQACMGQSSHLVGAYYVCTIY